VRGWENGHVDARGEQAKPQMRNGGINMRHMNRFAIVVATVFTLVAPVGAAPIEVAVDDNLFTPSAVSVAVGGTVHWSRAAGSNGPHNVHQDAGLFRSGNPTTGTINYTVKFSVGTYRYDCEVHGPSMAGFVRVPVKIMAAPNGLPFTIIWASRGTITGSKFDVQYRIGSGAWRAWKSTTARSAVFGASDRPVHVVKGKKYSFRARSIQASAMSMWSPIRSFVP
jgi:plastocyanin